MVATHFHSHASSSHSSYSHVPITLPLAFHHSYPYPCSLQVTEKVSLEVKHKALGSELDEASSRLKERTREMEALKATAEVREGSLGVTQIADKSVESVYIRAYSNCNLSSLFGSSHPWLIMSRS